MSMPPTEEMKRAIEAADRFDAALMRRSDRIKESSGPLRVEIPRRIIVVKPEYATTNQTIAT